MNPQPKSPLPPALFGELWPGETIDLPADQATTAVVPGGLVIVLYAQPNMALGDLYLAGHKVLAANPNPLPLLAIRASFDTTNQAALLKQFINLGDSMKGSQPLHRWLDNLYQTICPQCQAPTAADAFIWQSNPADPQQVSLRCPVCHFSGWTPVTAADLTRLDQIETRGVHYHYLLGRTVGQHIAEDNPLRRQLEKHHDLYTPRALYAIAEIIMKIEATISEPAHQAVLKSLLLSCLGEASSLFGPRPPGKLPQRLQVPARFIEKNVWRLFKQAVQQWQPNPYPVRTSDHITDFLQQRQNSVHFFPDHIRQLKRYLPDESVSLIGGTVPSPPSRLRALETLWSGWLLGLKAAEVNYAWLSQPRPDWFSYQTRLKADFQALRLSLKPEAHLVLNFSSGDFDQLLAVLLAALQADFDGEDWQISAEYHTLTFTTIPSEVEPVPVAALPAAIQSETRDAVLGYVQRSGRPDSDAPLWWAAYQSLLFSGLLGLVASTIPPQRQHNWLKTHLETVIDTIRQ